MKTTLSILLLGLALSTAPFKSSAGPLERSDLPAAPAWLAHVDWDGLRGTAIGQFIQGELDKPEAQAKLAAFQAIVSIDLRTQLHGTTLYGTSTKPQDGVVIVYADFDPNRLLTLAKAAKDSQSSTYKTHTIYNWIDEKKQKHGRQARVYAAIAGPRIVFGQREEPVAQALDVLDHAAPSLGSSKEFPGFGTPNDNSFLEGAARKLDLPDSDPNAAILRMSRQVSLQVAQVQQRISATLTLEAADEEVAGHMTSIAQGLVSLMKLQKDKPESTQLADALTLKQDGSRVVITLNLPGKNAVDIIKADAARKAAKKAESSGKTER